MTKTLIGIGNAAIDGTVEVESDSALKELDLIKGSCVFVGDDDARMARVFELFPDYRKDPGGAAANAVSAYAALGGAARFVGKAGRDDHGIFFTDDMHGYGIAYDTRPSLETQSTFLFSVVTPDRDRSFLSNHGASHDISPNDLNMDWFADDAALIIDGYMLMSQGGPATITKAMEYAQSAGSDIIFMPCSLTVVLEKAEQIKPIMAAAQSIICNEDEALGLTQTDNYKDIRQSFDWGVITLGSNGAWWFNGDEEGHVPVPQAPTHIENTNGAGDNFAGGFLYGLHQGMNYPDAVRLGQLCALHVIAKRGARCDKDLTELLTA